MFQESEVFNLLLGVVTLAIVFYEAGRRQIPGSRMFLWAFVFICAARFFTVVEGFGFGDLLNILEHISYAFAGIAFAVGTISLTRDNNTKDLHR